ncbi:thiosulfate oxidation carrier complex protein SoxZ [Roseicella aerolata]|uniref:Thiosulfate oxidation carrier complex protein SoxZ n=1 Tax=Roseicella aerolata TaxID=2883479 RepID=A0A9X1LC08_9PROT|nr:thiosulfate oxidation carrier complex protein SoxZ [Roseicella aerolata]MCB4823735.1 thiosulfate oxidation carrier complex protein SoxZ [Roseicella aerolata]
MAAPIGQPRVRLPASAKAGEIIEIRTLISHVMETGNRRDQEGKTIPRDIIKRFVAKFDGQEVFAMDLATAISANPYIAFPFKVEKAGSFEFTWTNDAGEERKSTAELKLA